MKTDEDKHINPEDWETCVAVLKKVARNPELTPDVQELKGLVTKIYKQAKRTRAREVKQEQKAHDLTLQASTGLFQHHLADYGEIDLPKLEKEAKKLLKPIHCYCCKVEFDELHDYYHRLCPNCAQLNYAKRSQSANLAGRTALITGGRIKIGFETALKLLRDGANVLVTTRFPKDAAQRFSQQQDAEQWNDRLQIYGLDLRHLPSVEEFIQYVFETQQSLDILINNAAQTIKRPWEFYQHLAAIENQAIQALPAHQQELIGEFGELQHRFSTEAKGLEVSTVNQFFPEGQFDQFGQALDLRNRNSWSTQLHEVDTRELLEVQLVNAISPFLLCSRLKPLFLASKFERKFIVNVSAMEGQFSWQNKTSFHPHTNMAKAALNMLTRTSAADYATDNIYMNSVDTGWITEENPHDKKMKKLQNTGFVPPLDIIDGASRVYDPIARGINESDTPIVGQFLKDYQPYPW